MIEPFLSRLPQKLADDPDSLTYFRELIDWIESGFLAVNVLDTSFVNNTSSIDNFAETGQQVDNQFTQNIVEEISAVQEENFYEPESISSTIFINGTAVEVLNGQIADVANNGVALLENNPDENYLVRIRNSDGSRVRINGQGRLINGLREAVIPVQYTVRVIKYFIDTDSFGVI